MAHLPLHPVSRHAAAVARRRRRFAVVALALALPLAAALLVPRAGVEATTVVWLDDDALIDLSQQIVHGEVVAARSHWDPATRRVYTTYTFRPFEVFKAGAAPGTEITFREWGGEANGVRCWIPGTGRFEVGDEVVAFLGRPDPRTGIGFTTGLAQGKFTVHRSASGARAVRNLAALSTVQADGRTPRPHEASDERPLESLLCRIRERCGR